MVGHVEKLPQAPLQEVIFEVHWKLDIDKETGLYFDPGFQMASGRFDELASSTLTHFISLKPKLIPDHLFSFKAVHQYWKSEKTYPVMQLGPGLFSVNETEKNYVWKDFKVRIFEGLNWLQRSYRNQLILDFIELRYIDAVEMTEDETNNLPEYLEKNLNVIIKNKIDLPQNNYSGLQLTQRFKLASNDYLNLVINNGIRNIDEAKVVLWHISVNHAGNLEFQDIEKWLENAHNICSNLFKKIISKEFYERFSKTN